MADSDLYDKLSSTAKRFIESCQPNPTGSNQPNADKILSNFAPEFQINFGHKTFVSTRPLMQGNKDGPGFIKQLSDMAQGLETWRIEITQVIVDVKQKTAMVRGDYFMTPKGETPKDERTVLNDIIITMTMDGGCEKLVAATEFIDPVAGAEIGRLMASNRPDYL